MQPLRRDKETESEVQEEKGLLELSKLIHHAAEAVREKSKRFEEEHHRRLAEAVRISVKPSK